MNLFENTTTSKNIAKTNVSSQSSKNLIQNFKPVVQQNKNHNSSPIPVKRQKVVASFNKTSVLVSDRKKSKRNAIFYGWSNENNGSKESLLLWFAIYLFVAINFSEITVFDRLGSLVQDVDKPKVRVSFTADTKEEGTNQYILTRIHITC